MIPKYLKIKGLYSYQKEQEIRFDALTDASLFGIFGSVGSGKSSILEAITFALYGDTERLNRSGDDRTYNMMNLRSDELLIDFECVAGKSGNLYRFIVRGKRNSKNFKEVKTFDRRGYIWQNEAWVPLADHETTESIVGLSYDNFRRTIIIPQGRFQEFIELKDAERTRMMKELFQLEKYDLSKNVGSLSKQNDLELSSLDGQLLALGEVTPQMMAAEESARAAVKTQIKESQDLLLIRTEQEGQFIKMKQAFEKVQILVGQLSVLEEKVPVMEQREEMLRIFEICSNHFKIFIEQKKSLASAVQRDGQIFEKNTLRTAELDILLAKQKEILMSVQPEYDRRETLPDMAQELEKALQIKDNIIVATKSKSALSRGEDRLKEKGDAIELLKIQKIKREAENEEKKSKLTDLTELSLVKSWFATLDEIMTSQNQIVNEGSGLRKEIESRKAALSAKIAEAGERFNMQIPSPVSAEALERAVGKYLSDNEIRRKALIRETLLINTRRELQRFAGSLQEGTPCPLCGAEHHPSVLHMDHQLPDELREKEQEQTLLNGQDELVRQFYSNAQKDLIHVESLESQINAFRQRYKEIADRLEKHNQQFIWVKFDKSNREGFDTYFAETNRNQREIRDTEALIKSLTEKIDTEEKEKEEKIEKPLQELRNEILKVENTISTLIGQLEKVDWTELEALGKEIIEERIAGLKKEYMRITSLFEKTAREIDISEKERDMLAGSQATLLASLETNQQELSKVQNSINDQLPVYGFSSEDAVNEVLSQSINIAEEKKTLEDFQTEMRNTKRDLAQLQQEHAGEAYDADKHAVLTAEKDLLTASLNNLRKEEGRLDGHLKKMVEDLARKATLLKEKDRLLLRKEHLDDLAKLFRSSGFVDYASSIYLRNLIQAANHRFHQMTYQQLHLELGEGNSFWVRDLLNGGHMRLLKTLSGGQKFQAALSLALALADHIHVRNKSVHNFFFLDEGFGSLDKNALQTVFETLKSLRKENRIVGIISHVEDLQQEIQTYLRVEESEEGSRIVASWQN